MQENTNENNSEYGHFLRSDCHQEVRFSARTRYVKISPLSGVTFRRYAQINSGCGTGFY